MGLRRALREARQCSGVGYGAGNKLRKPLEGREGGKEEGKGGREGEWALRFDLHSLSHASLLWTLKKG